METHLKAIDFQILDSHPLVHEHTPYLKGIGEEVSPGMAIGMQTLSGTRRLLA